MALLEEPLFHFRALNTCKRWWKSTGLGLIVTWKFITKCMLKKIKWRNWNTACVLNSVSKFCMPKKVNRSNLNIRILYFLCFLLFSVFSLLIHFLYDSTIYDRGINEYLRHYVLRYFLCYILFLIQVKHHYLHYMHIVWLKLKLL